MNWLEDMFDQNYPRFHTYNSGNGKGYNSAQSEHEALDHAISLSLSEHDQRSARGHDMDEELARALQDSMNLHLASSQAPSRSYSFQTNQATKRPPVCGGCKKNIGCGHYLNYIGALWHPHCFRCHACGSSIRDQHFSTWGNQPYHMSCYRQLSLPKCDVCKNYVPANSAGLIEYRVHPYWKQKFCPMHETDGISRCCSCERLESKDVQYVSLGDGRKLCLECLSFSIMDTAECQPLYYEILNFYEGMNMKINQKFPMLLVERQALNEAEMGSQKGHHNKSETRGLCLSEERTVTSITRRPTIGAGNQMVNMRRTATTLTRHCEVTAILALYGLPRLLTGSVLAHELMHAWLRLNGYRNLEPVVEEGICQVMAHMWLECEVMAGSSSSGRSNASLKSKAPRSAIDKRLGEFFLQQISKDTSPIYGNGFRAGHASMMKYGLRRTLDHIRLAGSFPL